MLTRPSELQFFTRPGRGTNVSNCVCVKKATTSFATSMATIILELITTREGLGVDKWGLLPWDNGIAQVFNKIVDTFVDEMYACKNKAHTRLPGDIHVLESRHVKPLTGNVACDLM